MMIRRHDDLCEEFGHDSLCRDTEQAIVPYKPDGRWPAGVGGNRYGPRRLRNARALIDHITDYNRTLIERLAFFAGLCPDADGRVLGVDSSPMMALQLRAMMKLADIQGLVAHGAKHELKHTGTVKHVAAVEPEAMRKKLEALTDEQLALLEGLEASDRAEDAEFVDKEPEAAAVIEASAQLTKRGTYGKRPK